MALPMFPKFVKAMDNIEDYLERFEIFAEIQAVPEDKNGKYFISCGSKLYSRLKIAAVPNKLTELTFSGVSNLYWGIFDQNHKMNSEVYCHYEETEWREPVIDLLNDLKRISVDCGFQAEERLNQKIMDRVIAGVTNESR